MAISYDVVRALIAATKDPESAEVRIAALAELGKIWMQLPADFSPEPATLSDLTFEGTVASGWFSAKGRACLGVVPDGLLGLPAGFPFGRRARVIILPDTET